ncbi:hypothetical protein TWF694_005563 [Orbilia ellipsospora]|uniref:F-box domain-containing protein n=1 Tax=Orbilia ellipsospora TaxID=2528407 RepID=A0AAV9WV16_9PEZI
MAAHLISKDQNGYLVPHTNETSNRIISNFPVELLEQVAEHCSISDLKALRLTNRRFGAIYSKALFHSLTLPIAVAEKEAHLPYPPGLGFDREEDVVLFNLMKQQWYRDCDLWQSLSDPNVDISVVLENMREIVVVIRQGTGWGVHPQRNEHYIAGIRCLNRLLKGGKKVMAVDMNIRMLKYSDGLDLAPLSPLTKLAVRWDARTLYFTPTSVSLDSFPPFPNLATLDIYFVDREHLRALSNLPRLKTLTFDASNTRTSNIIHFFDAQKERFSLETLETKNVLKDLNFSYNIVSTYLSSLTSLTLHTPEKGSWFSPSDVPEPDHRFEGRQENTSNTCNIWLQFQKCGVRLKKVDTYAPMLGILEYLSSYENTLEELNLRVRIYAMPDTHQLDSFVEKAWKNVIPMHTSALKKAGVWPETIPYVSSMGESENSVDSKNSFMEEIIQRKVFSVQRIEAQQVLLMCRNLEELETGGVRWEGFEEALEVATRSETVRRVKHHVEGFGKRPPPGPFSRVEYRLYRFRDDILWESRSYDWIKVPVERQWRMRVDIVPLQGRMGFVQGEGGVELALRD